jgi:hypothetical protein
LTRSRSDRRERLASWGRAAVKRLRHLGLDVDDCDVDDGGLLFVPDGRLTMTLDAQAVQVALVIAPQDLAALRSVLASLAGRALASLPEQFTIGLSSDPARVPAPRVSQEDLQVLIERADAEGSAVWLGWTVPTRLAHAHASTLDAQLQDALVALAQVLRFVAREGESGRARRARRHAGDRKDERGHGKARPHARSRDRDREGDVEPIVEAAPPVVAEGPAPRVLRAVEAKPRLRASLARRSTPRPGSGIDKGTRVRVLEGPFAGKEGLVQELDGNGGARVMLGLLAVRIDVNDLVSLAEGHGRPRLSSSHRRPVPVRS